MQTSLNYSYSVEWYTPGKSKLPACLKEVFNTHRFVYFWTIFPYTSDDCWNIFSGPVAVFSLEIHF